MASNVTKLVKPEAGSVHWLNECLERGKREVFSETITMTPALANIILAKNEGNRNVRPRKKEQFAADMRQRRWAFNGEPIIIAKSGELNDGQHRLGAIIDANVPIPLLIVFGVERATRTTVDQGGARGAADYLMMEGVQDSSTLASICRLVISYERSGYDNISEANRVTNAEVLVRAKTDERAAAAARFAQHHSVNTRKFAATSIIGFCHYVLSGEHPADAETYMGQVCTGENLRKTNPAYTVRDRLLNLGKGRADKIEVILRGWNAYRQGRDLKIAKTLGNFPALV